MIKNQTHKNILYSASYSKKKFLKQLMQTVRDKKFQLFASLHKMKENCGKSRQLNAFIYISNIDRSKQFQRNEHWVNKPNKHS